MYRDSEIVMLSIPTPVNFYFEDESDYAINGSAEKSWSIQLFTRTLMYGENVRVISSLKQEHSSINNISPQRIINDRFSRRKIWEAISDSEMPEVHVGAVEESFGLLDDCFKDNKLTVEQVLDILKKAK